MQKNAEIFSNILEYSWFFGFFEVFCTQLFCADLCRFVLSIIRFLIKFHVELSIYGVLRHEWTSARVNLGTGTSAQIPKIFINFGTNKFRHKPLTSAHVILFHYAQVNIPMELGAEVHRLVPKLFRAEVTRAEHRLSQKRTPPSNSGYEIPHK